MEISLMISKLDDQTILAFMVLVIKHWGITWSEKNTNPEGEIFIVILGDKNYDTEEDKVMCNVNHFVLWLLHQIVEIRLAANNFLSILVCHWRQKDLSKHF